MKGINLKRVTYFGGQVVLILSCVFATTISTSHAQSANDADVMQRRLARARALSAAHNLTAAVAELDSIRRATTDEAVREVARIMLMGVFLEEADYMRAEALLEETFKARSAQNENSIHSYFALAGQAVNGTRTHLERYRSYGINVADTEVPAEAVKDLDRLRSLLERVAAQAREISNSDVKKTDAAALLEDVARLRYTLARDDDERIQWHQEFIAARQILAASETRITSARGAQNRADTPTNPTPLSTGASVSPASSKGTEVSPGIAKPDGPRPAADAMSGATTEPRNAPARESNAARNPKIGGAAHAGQPVEVGPLIDKATQRVSPNYPRTAKNMRVYGVVMVYLIVDEKGAVVSVQRSSGPEPLRQAAMDAARQWKFRPTVVDGQPVRVAGFISFNFTL